MVVGADFHFGHDRLGNVELLEVMGARHGFDVVGIDLQNGPDGSAVSSTRIRELIAAGRVAEAGRLLGRHHELHGQVETGDSRGGPELGFPTANVAVPVGMALPRVGIYAGWYIRPGGSRHRAAISLGHRPTFHEGEGPHCSRRISLFRRRLYGEKAKVAFVERLR